MLLLAGYAALAGWEARVLRGEVMGMARARARVMGRRLPGGKTLGEVVEAGKTVIVRDDGGYLVCGRTSVRPQ